MRSHGYFSVPIHEVIRETESAISLVLKVPGELTDLFEYRPGQFLTLRVQVDGKNRHRCYSLASAPGVDAMLKITIKRVDRGLVSNLLCSNARAGQTILVQPPAGAFVPASLDQDFLLLAAGSGVTPVLSILKAALAEGRGHIALFYANRDEASVIFRDELIALSARYPDRLTIIHWLESVQGLPMDDHLAGLMKPFADRVAFICGPEPFMAASVRALNALGVHRDHIHVERFISLPDEEPEEEDAAEPGSDKVQGVTKLIVKFDGVEHEVPWPAELKMLEAMLAAGLDAPYSCRVGGCSACMCRVTSGEVGMTKNLVLDDRDLAEGWVLACQGYSCSAEVNCEIP
jgi:3-ketosteroid 9alpha-monooxygenase subunit B